MSEVMERQDVQQSPSTPRTIVNPPVDNKVDIKEFKFSFRRDKFGNTRPAVEIKLPVPSVEGVIEIFNEGGKGFDVIMGLVHNAVADHVRNLLNDDDSITSANFPYDKATWEEFVNTPESEKRGRGIAKEVWEAFGEDYVAQMPAL